MLDVGNKYNVLSVRKSGSGTYLLLPCFMMHCISGVNMFLHVQIVVKVSEGYFLFTKQKSFSSLENMFFPKED
jgi:hypothetical protein